MEATTDKMRLMLQDLYAQALTLEELFGIYYAVRSEVEKQAVYKAHEIAKMGSGDCYG